jgi:predicted permease
VSQTAQSLRPAGTKPRRLEREALPAEPRGWSSRTGALILGLLLRLGWPALLALLAPLFATNAHADGVHIAMRASSGAYNITLFTAPEPLRAGPADFSLLVQDSVTGEVLGDVTATGTLTPVPAPFAGQRSQPGAQLEAPSSNSQVFRLTHAQASNRLLLAASPVLPAPGSYTLVLQVARPGAPGASYTILLTAAPDHRRRTTLLFALALPLAAILLFLLNQHARRGRRRQLDSALH